MDAHARSVGVEDPHDPRVHAVVAVVRHGHGLGEPLGLVVDAPGADRVDVAPVGLRLRMHQGVPVRLGSRCKQKPGLLGFGQAQGLVRAQRPHFKGLDGQVLIIDRACG